ncbi:MAG: helix-turn-helix domain-containing protein [Lentisphaerae bacterium]|nr:helix-turn-helix domain-containing protein [Lentisphaerota bacterium]
MTQKATDSQRWLSLKEAATQLSVHTTTLRRWANRGEIPVMLTPGGHRRFSSVDIDLLAHNPRGFCSYKAIEQAWADRALSAARQEIADSHSLPWMESIDEEGRKRGRLIGQQLMAVARKYISGDAEEHLLAEARRLGGTYGQLCRQMDMPLTTALQVSISFRDSLLETAMTLPENIHVRPEANVRLLRRINVLLNGVHLAVAGVYDDSNNDHLSGA